MPKGIPKAGTRRIPPEKRCAICKHPERARIEALRLAGVSLDKLAEQFAVHRDAVWRHMERHVTDEKKINYLIGPGKIARLAEIAAEESQSVIDYLAILRSALFYQLDRLASENDHRGVATVAGQLLDVLKQIGQVTGQVTNFAGSTIINIQNNTQILNSAPFAELQTGLLRICADHPEARADIVALFRDLDAKFNAQAVPMIEAKTINGSAHERRV